MDCLRFIKGITLGSSVALASVPPTAFGAQTEIVHELRLATPNTEYTHCERVAPSIKLTAKDATRLVDGWVWVNPTDGSQAYLGPDLRTFSSTPGPTVTNFIVTDLNSTLLEMPIPANLPAGQYTLLAAGVVPASNMDCYLAVIDVANPGVASYRIGNLAPQTYYSTVTAYTYAGVESQPSNVVSVALGAP